MSEEEDLKTFRLDAARKQIHRSAPKKLGDAVGKLLARRGFTRVMSVSSFTEVWNQAVGEKFASQSRAGVVNRGVLEVTVRNSAVLQELTFGKVGILKRIAVAAPEHKIRDVRFKVGEIN